MSLMSSGIPHPAPPHLPSRRSGIQAAFTPYTASPTCCLVTMDRHDLHQPQYAHLLHGKDRPSLQGQGRKKGTVLSTKPCLGTPPQAYQVSLGSSYFSLCSELGRVRKLRQGVAR